MNITSFYWSLLICLPIIIPIFAVTYLLYQEFFIIRPSVLENPEREKEIRKKIRKEYMLGISRSNFLIIVVAMSTAIIGIYSAKIASEEGSQIRLHNELSVKPHLDIGFYIKPFPTTGNLLPLGAGYSINSNGLGPAVIRWMTAYVDGHIVRSWKDVDEYLKFPISETVEFSHFYLNPNALLRPGDLVTTYRFAPGKTADYLSKHAGMVEIKICYCSVYGEIDNSQCWQASNVPKSTKQVCEETPAIVLGELITT